MNRDKALIENQDERRQIARREFHGEDKRTWRGGKTRWRQRAHPEEASIRRDGAFVIILRNGNVKGYELSGAKVASTLHMGPYEQIGGTYQELMLWISEQGYRPSVPCREVYLVGPEQSDDPAEYRTEVQCPIVEIE